MTACKMFVEAASQLRERHPGAFHALSRTGFCLNSTPQHIAHTGDRQFRILVQVCQEGVGYEQYTSAVSGGRKKGRRSEDDDDGPIDTIVSAEAAGAAQSRDRMAERIKVASRFLHSTLLSLRAPPALVTVCRSVRDGYTPREMWAQIERGLLGAIESSFASAAFSAPALLPSSSSSGTNGGATQQQQQQQQQQSRATHVTYDAHLLGGAGGWDAHVADLETHPATSP